MAMSYVADQKIEGTSSNPQIEADLLLRLRAREPDALTQVVRDHASPLFRAARGVGLSKEEAEDVVQDVLTIFLYIAIWRLNAAGRPFPFMRVGPS
jgi:DNA-directed RNA polymerase specialized sigma24 family protein